MANYIQNYNGGVQFKTGSSQGLTVDIDGKLGVGTTLSDWTGSTVKPIELEGGFIAGRTGATHLTLGQNCYHTSAGGWMRKNLGYATNYTTTDGTHSWSTTPSGAAGSAITWNTAMTLDASGNLLLGTPSQYSGAKFSVYGAGGIALADSSTANVTSAPTIKSVGNNLVFSTDASTSPVERIRIDTNGNVGVGVIPSTWNNSQKVIQVANSSFYGYGTAGVSAGTIVGQNFFYDGQSRYISSGPASQTTQTNGTYIWYTAPSGIAGATTTITSGQVYTVTVLGASTLAQWQAFFSALSVLPTVGQSITATATGTLVGGGTVTQVITFNQAMTLDASGRLGVGTSSPSTNLHIGSGTTYQTTGYNSLGITNTTIPSAIELSTSGNTSGAEIGSIFFTNQSSAISGRGIAQIKAINGSNSASGNLLLFTQGGSGLVERMRIDSSGTVVINNGIELKGETKTHRINTDSNVGGTNEFRIARYTTAGVYEDVPFRINPAGNIGIGTTPSSWFSNRKVIQFPYGAIVGRPDNGIDIYGNTYLNASGTDTYFATGAATKFISNNGAYSWNTAPSGAVNTNISWTQAMTLDNSGNLLLTSGTGALGYGTGAGGTVTQLTSKSTAVTLNKPTGQIIMNNAGLSTGARIEFILNNTLIQSNDLVYVTISGGTIADVTRYRAEAVNSSNGACYIRLTNLHTTGLGEAVQLQFAVIKGAIS